MPALGRFVGHHGALEHLGDLHLAIFGVGPHDRSHGIGEECGFVDVQLDLCEAQVADVRLPAIGFKGERLCVVGVFPIVRCRFHFHFHGFEVRFAGAQWNFDV